MGRNAKLTKEQVDEIRKSPATQQELAVRYGVSRPTILAVLKLNGAYRNRVLDHGTPVLDEHGRTVGIIPA